jgi:hypothetical protein
MRRVAAVAAVGLAAVTAVVAGVPLPGMQVQAAHAGVLGVTRLTNVQATPEYRSTTVRGKLTEATLGVAPVPAAPIHVDFYNGAKLAAGCNTTTGLLGEFECFAPTPWGGPTNIVVTYYGSSLFMRTTTTVGSPAQNWSAPPS